MHLLRSERSGERICDFVRDFDFRNTDTWVLRSVYDELSKYLGHKGDPFPIHADDRWIEDLDIDEEDMFCDLLPDIAYRARRSLDDTEGNPYCGRVITIRDMVHFLQSQPKLEDVEPSYAGSVR